MKFFFKSLSFYKNIPDTNMKIKTYETYYITLTVSIWLLILISLQKLIASFIN